MKDERYRGTPCCCKLGEDSDKNGKIDPIHRKPWP